MPIRLDVNVFKCRHSSFMSKHRTNLKKKILTCFSKNIFVKLNFRRQRFLMKSIELNFVFALYTIYNLLGCEHLVFRSSNKHPIKIFTIQNKTRNFLKLILNSFWLLVSRNSVNSWYGKVTCDVCVLSNKRTMKLRENLNAVEFVFYVEMNWQATSF